MIDTRANRQGPAEDGVEGHAVEQRASVEFLRRMLATIEAGAVDLPAFPHVVIQVQEVLKNPNYFGPDDCTPDFRRSDSRNRLLQYG